MHPLVSDGVDGVAFLSGLRHSVAATRLKTHKPESLTGHSRFTVDDDNTLLSMMSLTLNESVSEGFYQ